MPPKLRKVIRLDSLPLNQTYFTDEEYLIDRPIVTSTGIFEYYNPDGTVRRELRLPEDVFDPESLKSYKAKPIIITHDAGLVTSDNVTKHQIGTILTEGYRSGDDVRAEIVIHDTEGMKRSGLRELSLGYNLELEETEGEWNGQHYDAIQRNIRINHLALVREARAGEQARLNLDGRDPENTLKGGKAKMPNTQKAAPAKTHRADSTLKSEELAKAIEDFKDRRAKRQADSAENKPAEETVVDPVVTEDGKDCTKLDENASPEEKLKFVTDRRAMRDEDGEPDSMEKANAIIAHQDEDIETLMSIIDAMKAEKDFQKDGAEEEEEIVTDGVTEEETTEDTTGDDEEEVVENTDGVEEEEVAENADCDKTDSDDDDASSTDDSQTEKTVLNADSVDNIVKQRIKLGMLGRSMNIDGLEDMSIMDAKKVIINAVKPTMHLDGKSEAYINAAYDYAVEDIKAKTTKDTDYQKRQMFNKDSAQAEIEKGDSSANARQRMIERQLNRNKEEK